MKQKTTPIHGVVDLPFSLNAVQTHSSVARRPRSRPGSQTRERRCGKFPN